MSDFDDSMKKIFGTKPPIDVEPVPIIETTNTPMILTENIILAEADLDNDLNDMYRKSKENLEAIIDQGKEAMKDIYRIATESEHPRAFEVYAGLLKNVVDANEKLITMQKQMRELETKKKSGTNTNIDKAIFVGSTKELLDLVKGK